MRFLTHVAFILIYCTGIHCTGVLAQEDNKFTKPLNNKNTKPATESPASKADAAPGQQRHPGFNPQRKPLLVSEDTTDIDEGELSVVEITEEVKVDSSWIKIAEYYSVWDSRNVDPYGIDPKDFDDSVEIQLYDQASGQGWSSPLNQLRTTSSFGLRGYRWHYGTDLDLNTGDTIRAAFDGIVRIVRYEPGGWGYFVLVRHYNGLETLYGHMSRQLTQVGQLLRAGDVIGLGGSTGRSSGPHLHYEVRYQGNAFDPSLIYNFAESRLSNQYFSLLPSHFAHIAQRRASVVRRLVYYRVRRGDTLGGIATRHGTTITKLTKLNRIGRNSTLRLGQRVRIK